MVEILSTRPERGFKSFNILIFLESFGIIILESFLTYWFLKKQLKSIWTFGFFWILLKSFGMSFDSFSIFWNLLESFGYFWILLESLGIFWVLLGSFGILWNLLDSFELFWNVLDFFGFFCLCSCLCRLSLQLNSLNPL